MFIQRGFPEHQRDEVVQLFWRVFSGKLGRVMAPEAKALHFLHDALRSEHAISAQGESGELLGIAGFKTDRGGLVVGTYPQLARSYGWFGALWRGPLLDLTDRPLKPGQLLLDGLFVHERARGLGVGTALIEAIVAEAAARGMHEVRLEVIDSNFRARALYERRGFTAVGEMRMGVFSHLFSFRHATTMCLPLGPGGCLGDHGIR
ncbi:GNAT family N-acetyltransferase [Tropicimonas sp. IMCC34043]|uniref:GNAT family N-acetyltransferase n=1 Tax=Tropicimonas sp. IMCC34043 TaxID=2248760 RepID=UPI000E227CEF|nr:GNAT family N-acetyltransferase [Tropicimonas sp. IMCC34043]